MRAGVRRFGSRHPVQTFKRCGGRGPSLPRGWRRRAARAELAGPGRWLRLLLPPPPPPSPRSPQLPPAGSPVQPRCPAARPGPGPRPSAQLASVRPERAAAYAAPRSSDGQHGAQDPARYAGSPARGRALGCSSPRGTSWVTSGKPPPLWNPRRPAGWTSVLPGPHVGVRLAGGFALREGGYRVLVTLRTPILVLPALARGAKWQLGRCCAPPRLCSSLGALMRELGAPWGLGVGTGAGLPKASDGQSQPLCGDCSYREWRYPGLQLPSAQGTPAYSCPAPPPHELPRFGQVPTRTPGCAPLWCPLIYGL